jgi:hypothetical protein
MNAKATSTTAGGSITAIIITEKASTTVPGLVSPSPVMEPYPEEEKFTSANPSTTSGQVQVPTESTESSTLADSDIRRRTLTPPTSLNDTKGSDSSVDDGELEPLPTQLNTTGSTPIYVEEGTLKPEGINRTSPKSGNQDPPEDLTEFSVQTGTERGDASVSKRGNSDNKGNGSDSFGKAIIKAGSAILIAAFVIFSVLKTWSICTGNSDPVKCACFNCIFNALATIVGAMWKLLKICCRRISPRSNLSATRDFRMSRSELLASDELDNYYAL